MTFVSVSFACVRNLQPMFSIVSDSEQLKTKTKKKMVQSQNRENIDFQGQNLSLETKAAYKCASMLSGIVWVPLQEYSI